MRSTWYKKLTTVRGEFLFCELQGGLKMDRFAKVWRAFLTWWTGWEAGDYLVYNTKYGYVTVWRIIGGHYSQESGDVWEWEQVRRGFFRGKKVEAPYFFREPSEFYRFAKAPAKHAGCTVHRVSKYGTQAKPPVSGWVCMLKSSEE